MKIRLFFLSTILFVSAFIPYLSEALERDFVYSVKGKNLISNEICLDLLEEHIILPKHLDLSVVPLLKQHQRTSDVCFGCNTPRQVYAGYFTYRYQKVFTLLNNQIAYTKKISKLSTILARDFRKS